MHASVGLRRRSRTSSKDGSKRLAVEVAVESFAAPHERAVAAASPDGSQAAIQLGFAKRARRLEPAVGRRFSRRKEWLARCRIDEPADPCRFLGHGMVHGRSVPFPPSCGNPAGNDAAPLLRANRRAAVPIRPWASKPMMDPAESLRGLAASERRWDDRRNVGAVRVATTLASRTTIGLRTLRFAFPWSWRPRCFIGASCPGER